MSVFWLGSGLHIDGHISFMFYNSFLYILFLGTVHQYDFSVLIILQLPCHTLFVLFLFFKYILSWWNRGRRLLAYFLFSEEFWRVFNVLFLENWFELTYRSVWVLLCFVWLYATLSNDWLATLTDNSGFLFLLESRLENYISAVLLYASYLFFLSFSLFFYHLFSLFIFF